MARDGETPPAEVAIARCRHALRMARAGAHPRVHLYAADDPRRALDDLQLATLLQHALEQGSFRLVFQPQVEIASGQVVGSVQRMSASAPTIRPVRMLTFGWYTRRNAPCSSARCSMVASCASRSACSAWASA